MTRNQISIRQKAVMNRRQPLLALQRSSPPPSSVSSRFAEAAGVTAADCAALACCCPFSLVNLLVLAVFKLPAGLYKRATRRRRRRRLMKKGLLPLPSSVAEIENSVWPRWGSDEAVVMEFSGMKVEKELLELEKEMRERFYSSGFWRSPSEGDA